LVLLDTTVVLHVIRQTAHGKFVLEEQELAHRSERPLISVVTVGEVLAMGIRRGWEPKKRNRMSDVLSNLVQVDIGASAVLQEFAELDTYAKKKGRGISDNDLWIAACARVADATLITDDKDFEPLADKGLKVVVYSPKQGLVPS
jgi:tRNA(fMet)-specific endonuclease VapC